MSIASIEWRLVGCGVQCGPRQHDPYAHELHGLLLALRTPPVRVVRTGPLVVDRGRQVATVGGQVIQLGRREWQVLDYLAARPNEYRPHNEIARDAWGSTCFGVNAVRTVVGRVRDKLGWLGRFIETRPGFGYRLRIEPPVAADADLAGAAILAPHRWATHYDRCACCGKTDFLHKGHGRCSRCKSNLQRYPHVGPCGAPS